MSIEIPLDGADPSTLELRAVATVADLNSVDIEGPIRQLAYCDPHAFFPAYEQAFVDARAAEHEPAQVVYRLFYNICTITLRTSDPAYAWGPWFETTTSRGAIPDDIRGEQTASLAIIVDKLASHGLRARVADICWSNNRRDGTTARAAIAAYCDCVSGLLSGLLSTYLGQNPLNEALSLLRRAFQIAKLAVKRDEWSEQLLGTFATAHQATLDRRDLDAIIRAAELALGFGLRTPIEIASELELAANEIAVERFPLVAKQAYDLAAQLYQNMKDEAGRQRCLSSAVDRTLAMRDQVKHQAAAEAAWVMDALQQLRHVNGREELEYSLEIELRRLQKASLTQMGRFEVDLQLGDIPEQITDRFQSLSLSDALKAFMLLARSRDPEELRAEAREVAKASPLMALMPVSHLDDQGRTEVKTPGAPHEGEPADSWYTHMIEQSETIRRQRAVVGWIDPARLVINARFSITERHFNAIVGSSGVVPEMQKPIVALGFARLFQGDYISATHLLIPQIEPCLRQLLLVHGHDPSKRRDNSTEEDLSLDNLFRRFRPQLETILTPALAFEIDRLFNVRPGPALRHELAHGQISAGACFHPTVYYGNWLIYRLCCLPLGADWDRIVAPYLAADE